MLNIVTGDGRPIFKQIVDEIRVKIVTGVLPEGTKLPSVRGLAMQLTVNTNTVAKAYEKLSGMGLIESRKGLGLFVAPRRQLLSDEERERRLQQAVNEFVTATIDLDFSSDEVIRQIEKKLSQLASKDLKND
jgi:DNA-binding transcriptional regulator YhcF (GntR family)